MKLSVIMPSFKEAGTIRENLKETERAIKKLGIDYEIILVDDGSKENVAKKARGISKNIHVYRYEKNQGKGHALKVGFSKCTGDLVTFFDADLDIPPHQIKTLIDHMDDETHIVVGSKRHPLSKINYPLKRKALSLAYQMINRGLFGLSVRDTQVGIKLFRRPVLKKVLPMIVVKKYAFDLELLVVAHHHNFKIREAPIEIKYKFDANSGLSSKSIWHIFQDTMAIAYRLYILKQYKRGEKSIRAVEKSIAS